MKYEINIVKNTLPYIQPYSINAIKRPFNMGDRVITLGDYRNKDEAQIAYDKIIQYYNTTGNLPRGMMSKQNTKSDPITILEERMKTKKEHIEIKPENKRRKISLDFD